MTAVVPSDAIDASADLIAFARKRPRWQQDALRRLAVQDALTAADITDFLTAIKVERGVLPKDKMPALVPIEEAHLASTSKKDATLSLRALTDTANVNQLKPGEKLIFAPKGLTLIYGDNGSGKSGYTRIFKKASAARSVEDILADVFAPDFEKKPAATATFQVAVTESGKEREELVSWAADKGSPEILRQVRVFDRRAAVLYVEKDTDLAFVPFNLDLLDGLSSLCAMLKEKLDGEAKALDAERLTLIGAIPQQEPARSCAESITDKTKTSDLEELARWSEADAAKLKKLKDALETSEGALKTLRLKKGRLETLLSEITSFEQGLSAAAVEALAALMRTASELRQAAEATGKAAFSKDPRLLPGVGGAAWQALWEAARNYSTVSAYPLDAYPVIKVGDATAQCVLCHQSLEPEAGERLAAFESFVKGDVEKKAKAAEKTLSEARTKLGKLAVASTAAIDEIAVEDDALAKKVRAFVVEADGRKAAALAACDSGKFDALAAAPSPVAADVQKHVAAVEAKILEIEHSMSAEQKAKDKIEIAALAARKSHADHKPTLLKLVANRLGHASVQGCLSDVSTNAVTRARKELNDKYVTAKFTETLKTELKAIGVRRNVTLDQKTAAAVRPVFMDTSFSKLEKILSDGEHRAVALACFLAESRMLGMGTPLVIDDPVSSLDHIRREQVAKRLVLEAKDRQVVIFTHDMVFWGEVIYLAGEERVPVSTKDLRRDGGLCGKVGEGDVPWPILPVRNRLQYIEGEKLPDLRKLHEASDPEYRAAARHVGELLRETWERLIEETLFQETVVRYRRSIETTRLMRVAVEDADWEKIHRGMTRSSRWAHDESRGTGGAAPSPDDLKNEVTAIRDLADQLRARGEDNGKRRKKSLEAAAA